MEQRFEFANGNRNRIALPWIILLAVMAVFATGLVSAGIQAQLSQSASGQPSGVLWFTDFMSVGIGALCLFALRIGLPAQPKTLIVSSEGLVLEYAPTQRVEFAWASDRAGLRLVVQDSRSQKTTVGRLSVDFLRRISVDGPAVEAILFSARASNAILAEAPGKAGRVDSRKIVLGTRPRTRAVVRS